DIDAQHFGSILMTALISLACIAIVLIKKVANPVTILVFAGLSYAVFAIVLSGILSPMLHGELQGPLTNPLAIFSVLATNALWGVILGVIAKAISRRSRGR